MKYVFSAPALAITLALLSANAAAAWTPAGDLFDGSGFYDKASVKRTGPLVSFNIMVNFKEPDPPRNGRPGAASTIAVIEMDCRQALMRRLSSEGHVGRDGTGAITKKNDAPAGWRQINLQNFARRDPMLGLYNQMCPAAKAPAPK